MTHFISFANTKSNFSPDRIRFEAENIKCFDTITCYTENDFDSEYLKKYGKHFSDYKRGYGYWSWKPYIIKKKLSQISDGDVVIYADCGCTIVPKNRGVLLKWIDIAKESDSGVLSPCYGPYIEHEWTRGDLYEFINKNYNKNNVDIFDKAIQCGATAILVCKKNKSVEFIDIWNDIMSNHFELCTDERSSIPNHPNFKENRHDQSVLSMLSKIYSISTIDSIHGGICDRNVSPIIATRIKNDKYTWKKPNKV